jgi:hypothetical protein
MLHHGKPCEGYGCVTLHNGGYVPLWDADAERRQAWADAHAAVAGAHPLQLKYFRRMAEVAAELKSSADMDEAELRFVGEVCTAGTFPKRQRFWRLVGYVLAN